MISRRVFVLAVVAVSSCPLIVSSARAEETLVAVAANFAEVIDELKPLFRKSTGHTLQSTTGSTGKLYAQIKEGAPFHILLSADEKTPERMEKEQLAVAGSRFTYAIGKLTLWSVDEGRITRIAEIIFRRTHTYSFTALSVQIAPIAAKCCSLDHAQRIGARDFFVLCHEAQVEVAFRLGDEIFDHARAITLLELNVRR